MRGKNHDYSRRKKEEGRRKKENAIIAEGRRKKENAINDFYINHINFRQKSLFCIHLVIK
jgi:hypothetical protein